jgi:hypothetical protein
MGDPISINQYNSGMPLVISKSGTATIYLECTLLKQVVKWMIEEERWLPESHRIRLRLRRSHESDTYCYEVEEVDAMLELCRGDAQPRVGGERHHRARVHGHAYFGAVPVALARS